MIEIIENNTFEDLAYQFYILLITYFMIYVL